MTITAPEFKVGEYVRWRLPGHISDPIAVVMSVTYEGIRLRFLHDGYEGLYGEYMFEPDREEDYL